LGELSFWLLKICTIANELPWGNYRTIEERVDVSNLGKVIERQKELGKSNPYIADILGMKREGWRQIRLKYENGTIKEYPFTYKQISALNRQLGFSGDNILEHPKGAMIFDEAEIFSTLLEEAASRDYTLVNDMLRCIAEGAEEDLPLLRQTANLMIRKTGTYCDRNSLMLLGLARNSVTRQIRRLIPDDKALFDLCETFEKRALIEKKKAFCQRYKQECLDVCEKEAKKEGQAPVDAELMYQTNIKEALKKERQQKELFQKRVKLYTAKLISEYIAHEVNKNIVMEMEKYILWQLEERRG